MHGKTIGGHKKLYKMYKGEKWAYHTSQTRASEIQHLVKHSVAEKTRQSIGSQTY